MLIRTYGMHWKIEYIEWGSPGRGNKGELNGTIKVGIKNTKYINKNFWDIKAVYVLEHNYNIIYIGKAERRALGKRLREHTRDNDPLADKWNMFSWFSPQKVKTNGDFTNLAKRQIGGRETINLLEALLIITVDPIKNSRIESINRATEAKQSIPDNYKINKEYFEIIIESLKKLKNE